MASLEDLLPKKGYVVAGKYQIEGTLGTGGMGAVFEVSHRITGKRFAVKWLLPNLTAESDAVMRFIREAQVAGRVDHPNVVEVYDVGQEGDSFYMVMELLQGEPLSDFLGREGKLTPAQACSILIPVMSGLTAAHTAGVIHRDLKPDNIYLVREQNGGVAHPKVLDFGISKMSNIAGEVTSSITRAGMVMGTPHYMAPEQVRAKPVDVRTDVYALGVILYEMLAGDLPFPGDTYSDLVLKIMTESPKPLGQLSPRTPPGLIKVIERAMARDPEARFPNVAELSRALLPFASATGAGASTGPAPAVSGSGRNTPPRNQQTPLSTESKRLSTGDFAPPRKPISLMIGLAAVALAVIGLGFWIVRIANQPVASPVTASKPTAAASGDAPSIPTPPPNAPVEKAGDNANAGNDLPTPNTVRIGPDPTEPARAWQPPPGSSEAPRPMGADPNAAPQPQIDPAQQQAAAKAPGLDEPPSKSTRGSSRSSSKRSHSSDSARGDKPNPPAPATPASGNHRSLGLSMDDF